MCFVRIHAIFSSIFTQISEIFICNGKSSFRLEKCELKTLHISSWSSFQLTNERCVSRHLHCKATYSSPTSLLNTCTYAENQQETTQIFWQRNSNEPSYNLDRTEYTFLYLAKFLFMLIPKNNRKGQHVNQMHVQHMVFSQIHSFHCPVNLQWIIN